MIPTTMATAAIAGMARRSSRHGRASVMNVDPTAAADGDEWQDRPVQLNRRTAAAIGLVVVGALLLGLNLGLRQFAGQAKEPEPSSNENLYHQADSSPARRQDYNYLDATRPKETVEPEAKPEPSVQAYRPPIRSPKPGGVKRRKRGARGCSRKAHRIFASAPVSPQPAPARIRSPGSILPD